MNITLSTDDLIVARESNNQLVLSDFEVDMETVEEMMDLDSIFDHILLERTQVPASRFRELNEVVIGCNLPDFPVILCGLSGAAGCVFLEGDVSWPLVFLDATKAESERDLQEIYVHEAAHLVANDQDHNFIFAAIHNLFRQAVGWENSARDYDYRGCRLQDFSTDESMRLSALLATTCIESKLPLQVATSALVSFIKQNELRHENLTVRLLDEHLETWRKAS